MKYSRYVFVAMLVFGCGLAQAALSDLQREKRLADEIVDTIMDGDPVYLQAGDHEFLAIYTEADGVQADTKDAAIILHGRGFHPDWQDTISPLRVGLAESGWNTLSVQMPVLEKEAKYYDYVPLFPEALVRIDAAIRYAREQGNERVVLIAHSCGSHMAMAWADAKIAGRKSEDIDAFVGIGMGATDHNQFMDKPLPLDKLAVPVLDVYGENDYPGIRKKAAERISRIKSAGDDRSSQVVIPKSNHYHADNGEELTEAIRRWLDSL